MSLQPDSSRFDHPFRSVDAFQLPVWVRVAGVLSVGVLWGSLSAPTANGQALEQQLLSASGEQLAAEALASGDPARGAVLFHQRFMACTQCHVSRDGEQGATLGPRLDELKERPTPAQIVEAILRPSKRIRQGFQRTLIVTSDGQTLSGVVVKRDEKFLELAILEKAGAVQRFVLADLDEEVTSEQSIMPAGLVNQLASRQQFLDLVSYVRAIVEGGPTVAQQLKPSASLLTPVLPEYESHVDHNGLIADLDGDAFKRGAEIYQRLCINCHGTHDRPGSLPTSLKFASGKFKNGSDPYTMYQTLTRGFGMMAPQTWMVPQQKYDVIHYIRESYLKSHNKDQFLDVTADYLAGLPQGDTRGPAPVIYEPWVTMDYGPTMTNTFEVGQQGENFAYKGIAVRLDQGAGGVSRGQSWMVFDHDTMRMAAAWTGDGFIDWNGIHFNGRHAIHPRLVGKIHASIPTGPGWADPQTGSFDDPRIVGRDGRLYGPLPRQWAHYKGLYHHDQRAIIEYTVGDVAVLESPQMVNGDVPLFARVLNLGRRAKPLTMRVARHEGVLSTTTLADGSIVAAIGSDGQEEPIRQGKVEFDGNRYVEVSDGSVLNMHDQDYTILARVKTRSDGVIFAKTKPASPWVPNGKALFIQGGRLTFDIGWVGAVSSTSRIADGKMHDIAAVYTAESGTIQLFVDGREDGRGQLKPKAPVADHVLRIGHSAQNFPANSTWKGEIDEVRLYQLAMAQPTFQSANETKALTVSRWKLVADNSVVRNAVAKQPVGRVVGSDESSATVGSLVAGIRGASGEFQLRPEGDLQLTIPAGEPAQIVVWFASLPKAMSWQDWIKTAVPPQPESLDQYIHGGPARWGELETVAELGSSDGPFAVDVLGSPTVNPWQCRIRLTGHDFLPGGDEVIVSAWDGDIWRVSGLKGLQSGEKTTKLRWRRIASGMFQPLGVRYHQGQIFVTCRDQLTILHDLNGDKEIDRYQSFNNDHQVTDHFHEFAMGLQIDDAGYFYYAKSARHALPALVPHHGTLLRISPDGERTDIMAVGFRAANGVCLNPDGTFIVTDQEGHWNPKNRINWVKPGGFYGNMFGYHDVTDSSDEAMTPPLCWITNSFDRSPAELLWVKSEAWGPLNGQLLNLSYGYGKVFVVPHEHTAGGLVQGGMCQLPIPQFPTGVMRGRFHPDDHQLYLCGMFAWAGSQSQPGGFYRLRYTGKPVHLPAKLTAHANGMAVEFTGELDRTYAQDVKRFAVKTWSLKRTKNYGSQHYDEKKIEVTSVTVAKDGRSLFLELEDIQPTWCMEIVYSLKDSEGKAVTGTVNNTIHELGASVDIRPVR
jgi:putative heme-binding domain-containing protein